MPAALALASSEEGARVEGVVTPGSLVEESTQPVLSVPEVVIKLSDDDEP
jgi:hypothetical protein